MAPLKKNVILACEAALRRIGFRKRNGALLYDRENGASGWLGLNLATQGLPDSLKINPVVGVYFARLQEVEITLRDDVPGKPMPVISTPLGYLMPEKSFRQWEFSHGDDSAQIAQSLADTVQTYGQPYIEQHSNWGTFSHEIAESPEMLMEHERAKTLPIILAINNDIDRAKGIVENELARVGNMDDMYAISYRAFASKFSARFSS